MIRCCERNRGESRRFARAAEPRAALENALDRTAKATFTPSEREGDYMAIVKQHNRKNTTKREKISACIAGDFGGLEN